MSKRLENVLVTLTDPRFSAGFKNISLGFAKKGFSSSSLTLRAIFRTEFPGTCLRNV